MKQTQLTRKLISRRELMTILSNITKSTPAGLALRTVPKMNVKSRIDAEPNPFLGNLVKISWSSVWLGVRYESVVNNERVREGGERDFVAASHSWAVAVEGTKCLYSHRTTGKIHVGYKLQRIIESEYRTIDSDETVNITELQQYLPPKKSAADHQGVEEGKEIKWNMPAMESIAAVTMNKVMYIVVTE